MDEKLSPGLSCDSEGSVSLTRRAGAKAKVSKRSGEPKQEKKKAAYPHDTADRLAKMIARYQANGRAQNVSFRRLVPWIRMGERATHYIHAYPAKLLPQIAHFFIASSALTKPKDPILDPFGGTGTVALEAILAGRNAYFSDVNPLAQLVAKAKTTWISTRRTRNALGRVKNRFLDQTAEVALTPDVVNINYWYAKSAVNALCRIKAAINAERERDVRNLLLVSFSSTCRKVSKADPRLSVPVRIKSDANTRLKAIDVWNEFSNQVESNVRRLESFYELNSLPGNASLVGNNARDLRKPTSDLSISPKKLEANSVPLIITSPPYAGAQKYIRASSLSLGWLDLAWAPDLKPLENASIGREHLYYDVYSKVISTGVPAADRLIKQVFQINKLRSAIIATYLNEMRAVVKEMARVLKPGGHLVLVIGNNEVCGLAFKSSEYLTRICFEYGLTTKLRLVDEIRSRGLMTKRNKTASVITREWVLLFEKSL